MAIIDKNTLKSWFLRGLKPLASQFAAWMDSYWHKNEKIPISSVDSLEEILNEKAEQADITDVRQAVTNVTNNFDALSSSLHIVATTGNYNDLNNLPSLALDDYVIAENFQDGILVETDITTSELADLNVIRLEFTGNTVNVEPLVGTINVNYLEGNIYSATNYVNTYHYDQVVFTYDGKIHFWIATNRPEVGRVVPKMYMRLKCTTDAENFNRIVNISNSENRSWPGAYAINTVIPLTHNDPVNATTLYNCTLQELLPAVMYNATKGLLIRTSIAANIETPFLLHVTANTNTDSNPPLDMYIQGTNSPAANAIIFTSGTTNQEIMSAKAFVYEAVLCFWLPAVGGKHLQAITCYTNANHGLMENRRCHTNVIMSITDVIMPSNGVTRLTTITPTLPTPPVAPIEDSGWLSTTTTPTTTNANVMSWDNPSYACRYRTVGNQCYFAFQMYAGAITGSCSMIIKLPASLFDRITPVNPETQAIYDYQDNSTVVYISKRTAASKELFFEVVVAAVRLADPFSIRFTYPLD